MTKKEYLVRLLTYLKSQRPLAQGLLLLVENNAVDDSIIDAFVSLFQELINKESDEKNKLLLTQSIGFLEKMKRLEKDEKSQNADDIENMESFFGGSAKP